ncbi:hypothetical protein vseg_019395 [Gypsophila vaccaria]
MNSSDDDYTSNNAEYDGGLEPPPLFEGVNVEAPYSKDEDGVSNAPNSVPQPPQLDGNKTAWTTGICNCYDDWSNCCVTCFCPCITFGKIAEIVDRGRPGFSKSAIRYAITLVTLAAAGPCLYSFVYRVNLRGQYRLHGSTFTDCLAHFLCEPCALCQEYRELKNRGFDMDIGWEANTERRNKERLGQNQSVTTAPPFTGPMTR